jgi:flagellar hook-basal body complex protein FliE
MTDFATSMSRVLPNSFVPDMSDPASEAPNISAVPADGALGAAVDAGATETTSFKDTVKQMLSDVNDKITTSDSNMRDLAMGKTNDTGKVITSVEEANLALQYTMAIRSKLLSAYQDISRITV